MIYLVFSMSILIFITLQLFLCRYRYFDFESVQQLKPEGIILSNQFQRSYWRIILKFIFLKKPNWIIYPKNKLKKFFFAVGHPLLELLLIVIFCSGAFSAAQLYIDAHTNPDLFKATIWDIEFTIHKINGYIKWLKPAFPYDVIVSVMFVFLSGIYISLKAVKKTYSKYLRLVGKVVLVFTVFTSFTFFGIRLDKAERGRAGKMESHAAEIIAENTLLLHDIKEAQQDMAIGQILSQPKVQQSLTDFDKLTEKSDSLSDYARLNPNLFYDHPEVKRSVDILAARLGYRMNFARAVEFAEDAFEKSYSKQSGRNFYSDAASADFNDYFRKNKEWFEHNVSSSSTAAAKKRFEDDLASVKTQKSAWQETYKEPLKKVWKAFYKKTFKAWTKPFVDDLNETIPFFSEFFDILVNDPLEDATFEKAYDAFTEYQRGGVTDIFRKPGVSKDKATAFNNSAAQAVDKINVQAERVSTTVAMTDVLLHEAIDKNFQQLMNHDSWNDFRRLLLRDINNISCPYFTEKKEVFKDELEAWERYLNNSKEQLYKNHVSSLEKFFFEYAKGRNDMMEALGRGIAWYKSYELNATGFTSGTVADAIKYYASKLNFDIEEISFLKASEAGGHACPNL